MVYCNSKEFTISSNQESYNTMNVIHRVLSVLFVLGICLVGVSYSAENSDCQQQKTNVNWMFKQSDIDRFEQMFQSGKFDFSYTTDLGANVLHYASAAGDLNRVKELVKQGADINVKDNHKRTALHYAALFGNLELVQWLVKQGADVKAKSIFGETALHYAACNDNMELVEWLVNQGLDVKAKDNDGRTVLHDAAGCGNLKLVQWLVECGADVNAKNRL